MGDKMQGNGPTDSLEALLDRYYRTSPPPSDLLEAALLDRIGGRVRGLLRGTCQRPDDVLDRHSEVNYRLIVALRRSRETGARRIENLVGLAMATVSSITSDALRRDNPWQSLRMRVYYLTTDDRYKDCFARWLLDALTLVGLQAQIGQAMRQTDAYIEFCRNDDRFVREALKGRHPANLKEVRLPELLEKLIRWIETPLKERQLIDHLAELRGLVMPSVESVEDAAARKERPADDLIAAPEPERAVMDWDSCLEGIREQTVNCRRVLLLSLNAEQLREVLGQNNPAPMLARLLEYPEARVAQILPALPMKDDALAAMLGVTKDNLHAIRSRARAHLRKKL